MGLKETQRRLVKQYESQLGKTYGAATRMLTRMLLFHFVSRLNLVTCFRCGRVINSVEEMSLDHVVSWRNAPNAKELFWNLQNVKLTHQGCNSRAASDQRRISSEEKKKRDNKRKKEWLRRRKAEDPEFRVRMNTYQIQWQKAKRMRKKAEGRLDVSVPAG